MTHRNMAILVGQSFNINIYDRFNHTALKFRVCLDKIVLQRDPSSRLVNDLRLTRVKK